MSEIRLSDDIFQVSISDRTTDLFEGLWPIEGVGITYNSYIVKDSVNVLIDLSKDMRTDHFFNEISRIIDLKKIGCVVLNHMEPDHTGVLATLRTINPGFEIVCTQKAAEMLKEYYDLSEHVRTVSDGAVLDTGKHRLRFHSIPFVHWPETMATYDETTRTLFPCDAFGGYGDLHGAHFDDGHPDLAFYEKEALRYFSNIITKFSTPVLNAIRKLEPLDIAMVAPGHGLIWRKNPGRIVELYKKWAQYAAGGGEPGITLLYGSMYGNTETMMTAVAEGICAGGVLPEIYDVARTHPSYILPSLLRNRGVAIGAPTYEVSLFPYMQQVLEKAALKGIRNRKAVYFGSYGWSRGAYKKVQEIAEGPGWELLGNLEFAGRVTPELYTKGYELGKMLAISVGDRMSAVGCQ